MSDKTNHGTGAMRAWVNGITSRLERRIEALEHAERQRHRATIDVSESVDGVDDTPEPRKPRECYRVMKGDESFGTTSDRGVAERWMHTADYCELVHFREILPGLWDESDTVEDET